MYRKILVSIWKHGCHRSAILYETTNTEIYTKRLLRTRSTFSKSVVVSVGMSIFGCTELIFIELSAKINGQCSLPGC